MTFVERRTSSGRLERSTDILLDVRDLHCHFKTDDGIVKAVDGVTFQVLRGESLGIVGESGSGKTVTNMAMMGLVPTPPGKVWGEAIFDGQDLLRLGDGIRKIRGRRVATIFQDPMTSLNPFLRIERQMTEGLQLHLGLSRGDARKRAVEWLEKVGIPNPGKRIFQYPHEFSGGMRQRVMIAMALSTEPELLIADEPTTALDVTIQAQILELIGDLQRELGTAVIMITHDLGVVAGMCERVVVMYAGRIVEEATAPDLFGDPAHPYTLGLLTSVPRLDETVDARLIPIEGQPPNLAHLPEGCAFAPRCASSFDRCSDEPRLEDWAPGRRRACWLAGKPEAPRPVGTASERLRGPDETDATKPAEASP